MELTYDQGSILLSAPQDFQPPEWFSWDPRVSCWRALGHTCPQTLKWSKSQGIGLVNGIPRPAKLDLKLRSRYEPHPYQDEALAAWTQAGGRGSVVLPTGSGKTYVALKAIEKAHIASLVIAPTIDLMNQWYALLLDSFGIEVGILGGGYHEVRELTVSTYDSAYIYAGEYGNRFGLLVFDEVHHLPSPKFLDIARMSIAPFRLGLTATYERQDGLHRNLYGLVGSLVYKKTVEDLKGSYLSDFQVVRLRVPLTEEEQFRYKAASSTYYGFVREANLKPYGEGWNEFVKKSAYDPRAREAMIARMELRKLASGASRKLEVLDSLLKQHAADKAIIFTESNEVVYQIAREFLLPAITHLTKAKERKWILDGLKKGLFPAVVTSKVLNEGIDVPDAKVAIILSGSASPREHIQRLGRILRKSGVRSLAVLYEVVSSSTAESGISSRRRQNAHA